MPATAKFSLAEYEQMVSSGAFEPDETQPTRRRLELLRGEIIEMSPVGSPHAAIVSRLTSWSFEVLPKEAMEVRVQSPVRLPGSVSMPEPDLVWARPGDYFNSHPGPDQLRLVIEVADSSLAYDRGAKAAAYAEAGIADYWVVNLLEKKIEVFREPESRDYQDKSIVRGAEELRPLASPDSVLIPGGLFRNG